MSQAKKKRVNFQLEAPAARRVCLAADFNGWDATARKLKRNKAGRWRTWTTLPPGRYEYRFVVDGEWITDPNCQESVANEFGEKNSVVQVS